MSIFDINTVFFQLIGYPISYLEFIATFFGFISIFLATRANIFTWHTGIINEFFLFILFFQVQLYADMFLQVFYFVITLYGLYNWNKKTKDRKISKLTLKQIIYFLFIVIISTISAGYLINNLHNLFPVFFKIKASYPFSDSLIMVLSISATFLLAKRNIETWFLWILVDIICVILYFKKEIYFLAFQYLIFLFLASYGLYNWNKLQKNE